jgi:hypothetical protein
VLSGYFSVSWSVLERVGLPISITCLRYTSVNVHGWTQLHIVGPQQAVPWTALMLQLAWASFKTPALDSIIELGSQDWSNRLQILCS